MAQVDGGSAKRKGESESYENPPTQKGILARSGEYWTVGYGAATFSLKDIKGLGYIERLLQHPGEEFHALDLMSGPGARTDSESATVEERELRSDPNIRFGRLGDAGEVLDPQATQDYKRRILELNEELEDLRERGDVERAEEVKSERDFLANELGRGMGLGGRVRRTGSVSERARLSVTRAIKAALQKISEHHAALGELLEHSIRTGTFCSYVPSPRVPVSWQFTLEGLKPSVGAEAPAPLFFRNETSCLRTLADQTTFVGREAERATLRRCLEQALDRKAKVVMIGGAPGVGKTRIAREIGAEASEQGFRVLAGSCYERDDSVPFMPVVEILETALAQATSPQAFREGLGNDAAEIARLMPQLRRIFTDIPPPLELSPGQSRRILFGAIAELLGRTAGNRPLLLLLEDLHWADEGTLSLLNYLARSVSTVPVMIAGTYRDHELDPAGLLAKTLDDLIRVHLVEQIGLRGLPQDAVAGMIRSLSGRAPPEAVVSLFYSNTEGNPFFIEELYQHLVERAGLLDSNGEFRRDLKLMEFRLPPSLRLVVGRRLARLSDETQKILGTAAVIGRSFTFELLEASTMADADSVLDWVEEAESAGLISATLQYPQTRFQFSHELIRKAVLEDLSAPRRQRLHLQIADAIKRLHADALEDHANDLAHHLWEAGNAANPDETVRYLAMAANRALAQLAYGEAARLYQMALDALAGPRTNRSRQGEMLLGLGEALRKAGNWSEAKHIFAQATKLARELGNTDLLARAALALGPWSTTLFGANVDAEIVALLEEALAAVGDRDSAVRATLLARLAQELAGSERRDRSLALCEESIEVARRVDDAGAMVSALWTQHQLHWGPHDLEKRLDAASEIVRLAEKAGALDWALSAREFRLSALIELGRIELADHEIETYAALQERTGQSSGTVERYRAMRCLMRGDFEQAERRALEGIRSAQRRQDQPLVTAFGTLMIQIRYERGRAAENEQIIRDYAVQFPTLALARCGLAYVYAREGREAEARQEFERFAADDFAGIPRDWNWIGSLNALCEVCIFLRDEQRAATLYELLRPYHRRNVTIGWGDVSYGSLEQCLGRLATLMRRFNAAEAHFVAALRFDQQMGAPPLVAHTRHEYGSMLLQRGRQGDPQEALGLLRQALDTASALGMKDLEGRVHALIAATVGPDTAAAPPSVEPVGGPAPAPVRRAIASVLFTDVVASTERVTELKDRRWAELQDRLHQALRKEVEDFGGREINTAGDGMLAIFNHPTEAIRCAFAIAASAEQLGLRVRAGIHTGECEFVGGNVAGIAVHIGARVAARAGAGEVMVSSTVRDLLAGGEMIFGDRGVTALKGIPGEWHLYAVEPPA